MIEFLKISATAQKTPYIIANGHNNTAYQNIKFIRLFKCGVSAVADDAFQIKKAVSRGKAILAQKMTDKSATGCLCKTL